MADMDDNDLAGEFVMRLFHSRTSAHVHHLQAQGPGAYAKHVALAGYYDGLLALVDSFAECYQGLYGIIPYPTVGYSQSADFLAELTALRAWVKKNRDKITDESELQNIIDEVMSLMDSTMYKLKFLK